MSLRKGLWLIPCLLIVILVLSSARVMPALAGETRSGKDVKVAADEVIPADVYCFGETIVVDGTVNGDLIATGWEIRINGEVKGDVIAAAKTIVVRGKVGDDARLAGFDVQILEEAQVADDVNAAGFSFIARSGSEIGGDAYVLARQAEFAGRLDGNLAASLDALKISGSIGGNVTVEVSAPEAAPEQIAPLAQFLAMPLLPSGLYITDAATINGKLAYTSPAEGIISPGAKISEQIFQTPAPAVPPETPEVERAVPEAPGAAGILLAALGWFIDFLRRFIVLIVFVLLLAWLLPIAPQAARKLQEKLWPSLGWGCLIEIIFFVAMPIIFAIIIGMGILLGVLTLGGLQGYFISTALLLQGLAAVIFGLITAYITKVIAAHCFGRWLLDRANSRQADGPVWPAVLGVVAFVIVTSIPVLGWIIGLVVTLFGLGALWLWLREVWWPNRQRPIGQTVAQGPAAPVPPAVMAPQFDEPTANRQEVTASEALEKASAQSWPVEPGDFETGEESSSDWEGKDSP